MIKWHERNWLIAFWSSRDNLASFFFSFLFSLEKACLPHSWSDFLTDFFWPWSLLFSLCVRRMLIETKEKKEAQGQKNQNSLVASFKKIKHCPKPINFLLLRACAVPPTKVRRTPKKVDRNFCSMAHTNKRDQVMAVKKAAAAMATKRVGRSFRNPGVTWHQTKR